MSKDKFTTSIESDILKAAREKSDETGVALSKAVERLLAWWIETGQLPAKPKKGDEKKPKK